MDIKTFDDLVVAGKVIVQVTRDGKHKQYLLKEDLPPAERLIWDQFRETNSST